jgi:type IV pilus biogenesis protein PilP
MAFLVSIVHADPNEGKTRAQLEKSLEKSLYYYEYKKEQNKILTEYYQSVEAMHDAQKDAEDARNGKNKKKKDESDNKKTEEDRSRRPAWQRGNPKYDQQELNKIKNNYAYVITISGRSRNLTAEVYWNGSTASVQKGDSIIGGDWKVTSISKSTVEISNGIKTKRLTNAKIKIPDLLK